MPSSITAQSNAIQVSAPPSPEASAFGKFGDIPVGEYTGSTQLSVPLYSIQHRGLTIPIGLSYHSNGIKVSEEASIVGLGWNLNTGGLITRAIRGYDDFGSRSLAISCSGQDNNYTNYWLIANGGASLPEGFASLGPYVGDDWQLAVPEQTMNGSSVNFNYEFANGTYNDSYFCQEAGVALDFESDLYSFSILGHTGKFIIGRSGEIVFLDASDLRAEVEYIADDDVRWTITTPQGVKVYLGTIRDSRQLTYSYSRSYSIVDGSQQENTCLGISNFLEPDQHISSWFIDRIILPTGEEITYNYNFQLGRVTPIPTYSATKKDRILAVGGDNSSGSARDLLTQTVTSVAHDNILLESISIPAIKEDVRFIYSSDRLDLLNGSKLSEVEVLRNDILYKKYELRYDYFTSSDLTVNRWDLDFVGNSTTPEGYPIIDFMVGGVEDFIVTPDLVSKRLRLQSVQELGYDLSSSIPPYSFTYFDGLPIKSSYATDHWGFFNGRFENSNFFPDYYPDVTGNLDCQIAGVFEDENSANRTPDDSLVKQGLLETITYPTGGSTTFAYESNEYQIDGLRATGTENAQFTFIHTGEYCDNNPIPPATDLFYIDNNNPDVETCVTMDYSWIIADCNNGLCSNPLCLDPTGGGFGVNVTFQFVLEDEYGNVIRALDWSTLDYTLDAAGAFIGTLSLVGGPVPPGNYRMRLDFSGGVLADEVPWNLVEAQMSISWDQYEPIEREKGAGARIARLTNYSSPGTIAHSKNFIYENEDGQSSGKVYNLPIYSYITEDARKNVYISGQGLSGTGGNLYADYSNQLYINRVSNSVTPLSNDYNGNFVGYSRVQTNYGDGASNGYIIKTFFNEAPPILPTAYRLFNVPRFVNHKNGLVLSDRTYTSTGSLVQSNDYNYNEDWGGPISALHSDSRFQAQWGYRIIFPIFVNVTVSTPVGNGAIECNNEGGTAPPSVFVYRDFPQWHYLETISTKVYGDDGSFIETIKEYNYESSHFNVIEEKISGGDIEWTTKYRYAAEVGSCIFDDHMTAIPLEVEAPNGITYTTEFDCTYRVPFRFSERYQNGDEIIRSEVTSFNSDGYALSINRFGFNTPETYTWKPSPAPDGLLQSKVYLDWEEEFYYNDFRQIERAVAIDDQPVEYTYDSHGRLHQIKARPTGIGGGSNVQSTITYDMGGPNIVTNETVYSDAPTQRTESFYDGLGRPSKTVINGVTKQETIYDGVGRVSASTYLPGTFTTYTYDGSPLNRVTSEIYPDGNDIQFGYSAEDNEWVVTRINERGFPTKNYNDILGRQSKMEDAIGGITDQAYDQFGRLVRISSPAGGYFYEYDDRNRLISKKVPASGTTSYCYDNATNLLCSSVDGNLNRLSYEYDSYQRETNMYLQEDASTTCNCNTSGNLMIANQYDGYGVGQENNPIYTGKLSRKQAALIGSSGFAETTYRLDEFGRIANQIDAADIGVQTISDEQRITLNHADWTLTVQHSAAGYLQQYSYDDFGRVISEFSHGVSTNMNYNDQDQLTYKVFDGGLSREDYEYNIRGWLTDINILRPETLTEEDLEDSRDGALCQLPIGEDETYVIEEEVDPQEFFELLCSGETVVVPDVDECPPPNPTCLEEFADYTIEVPFVGDFLKWFSRKFGNDVSTDAFYTLAAIDNIPLPGLEYCLNSGSGATANTAAAYFGVCEGAYFNPASLIQQDLINWLNANGYEFESVEVDYLRATLRIEIIQTNRHFDSITIGGYFYNIGEDSGLYEGVYVSHAIDYDFYRTNVKKKPCTNNTFDFEGGGNTETGGGLAQEGDGSGINTEGSGSSNLDFYGNNLSSLDPNTINLPTSLFEVVLPDDRKLWIFEFEITGLSGPYILGKEIIISSQEQLFEVITADGSVYIVNFPGLINFRNANASIREIDVVAMGPNSEDVCPPPPTACDETIQENQQSSLEQICSETIELFETGMITYPVEIAVVQLCNGEITYVLNDLTGSIYGPNEVINTFFIDEDGITVQIHKSEPFWAMQFDHQENGNIEQIKWKVGNRATSVYDYSYDEIDRVTGSSYWEEYYFQQMVSPPNGEPYVTEELIQDQNNRYNTTFSYDGAGNINSIWRNGVGYTCGPEGQIDRMMLTYGGLDGQQLINVVDEAPDAQLRKAGFRPFPSANHPDSRYEYDDNGNMTRDPHKLLSFDYNFLNLPEVVRKGGTERLRTVYDATGRKWSQTSTVDIMDDFGDPTGDTYTETRNYINGVEWIGEGNSASQLASINATSNGRFVYQYDDITGASSGSRVEYYHNDHLGNIRLAFSDLDGDGAVTVRDIYDPSNEIMQERHYYPFGLTHNGPWYATVAPDNAYRYNGKELDEATGLYEYGFRWYDPSIGRFTGVDPIADQFAWVSVYNYAENKPINAIDLHGLQAFFVHGTNSNSATWTNNDQQIPVLQELSGNQTTNADFNWPKGTNGLRNDQNDRAVAAQSLANHVLSHLEDGEDITLIGHSHGGNVSIQAVNLIKEGLQEIGDDRDVNLITLATPAYTGKDDPENPANADLDSHIHFYSSVDEVQVSGSNFMGDKKANRSYYPSTTQNFMVQDFSYKTRFGRRYKSANHDGAKSHSIHENIQYVKEIMDSGQIKK